MLVLKLPWQSRAPANAAVGAGHVRDGGARFGGFEAIGLRDHVGDLISAPTVTLDADVLLVNESAIDDGLHRGQDALQRVSSRIAGFVNNVRHKNQVAVADVISRIDRSARSRIAKLV